MQVSVNKKSERKAAYIFIIPAVVLLAAFLLYPALQTVRYAFTDYNIMRPDRIKFCGFNNFIELFQDKDFWIAVKNTLHFAVLVVPFQTILALALALLISSRRKGVSIFRAAYFSPQVTSMVVVARWKPVAISSVISAWGFPSRISRSMNGMICLLGTGRVWSEHMITTFCFPAASSESLGDPIGCSMASCTISSSVFSPFGMDAMEDSKIS